MKRTVAAVAVAAATLLLLVPAAPAWACTCAVLSAKQHLDASEVVFVGRVLSVTEPGDGTFAARFEVERIYKGDAGRAVSVESGERGTDCGVPFARGARYVVFASGATGTLRTGLCAGTSEDALALERAGVKPLRELTPAGSRVPAGVAALSGSPAAARPGRPGDPEQSRKGMILIAVGLALGASIALARLRPS